MQYKHLFPYSSPIFSSNYSLSNLFLSSHYLFCIFPRETSTWPSNSSIVTALLHYYNVNPLTHARFHCTSFQSLILKKFLTKFIFSLSKAINVGKLYNSVSTSIPLKYQNISKVTLLRLKPVLFQNCSLSIFPKTQRDSMWVRHFPGI